MKILKRLLLVLVIIIAIPLVVALFVKKEYAVEREIVIEKPEKEVFNYIRYLKNQNRYSKWATMDPEMKSHFEGEDGSVGFISSWESEDRNVGKGEQTIIKINEDERIDYDLHFIEPFESRSKAYMITEPASENETSVKWGFEGKMNYPMNFMMLFMDMEEMIGNDLSTGLSNLKNLLEK